MEEITLDTLRDAISQLKEFDHGNEVIGFILNPIDIEGIRNGTTQYTGIVNDNLLLIPPYQGMPIYSDEGQPIGYVRYVRRKDKEKVSPISEKLKFSL